VNIAVSVTHNKSALSSGVFPFFGPLHFFYIHYYYFGVHIQQYYTRTVLASRWYQFLVRIVYGIILHIIILYSFTRESYATFYAVLYPKNKYFIKIYYVQTPFTTGHTVILLLLL
jgi:hypothetical protein